MNEDDGGGLRALVPPWMTTAQQVRLAAFTVVGLGLALRAWQLYPAWFYSDDFIFLEDALDQPFGLDLLFTPHDSQLMPLGVAMTWIVAHAGPFSWGTAATLTLLLQAIASVCCLLMLRTLFGERWGILIPLALFLLAPMAPEAVHWWAASLNALPIQISFFLLVTAVTVWARRRTFMSAVGSAAALGLAVLSGPRGLVMVVPIGLLLMLVLTPGSWVRRPLTVVRRHWPLLLPLAAVGVIYLAVYRASTPTPVEPSGDAPALEIAGNLVGFSWLPSLVGGPWHWNENNPPMSQPDPPVALHVLAVAVVVIGVAMLVRRNPLPVLAALTILAAQLTVTYLALVFGRGLQLGAASGLLTRYLVDTLPVTTLALGLAVMPVLGTGQVERHRDWRVTGRWRPVATSAAVVFVVGSLVSTVDYARHWHDAYPARAFVLNAHDSLTRDPATIADVEVPNLVQSRLSFPRNLPSHLLTPYGDLVSAVTSGNDLRILDDIGVHRQAGLIETTRAEPGRTPGCGHLVRSRPVTVEVDRDEVHAFWWVAIGYLSSADGRVDVAVDDGAPREITVLGGLHTYFLSGEGAFSTIVLRAIDPDLTVCVDTVVVGDIEPVA